MDASTDERLPFTGLLSPAQVAKMREEFPNFIVCPSYVGRFGRADKSGFVAIPAATAGFHHAKRTMRSWMTKTNDNDKLRWWFEYIEEKRIKPVMSHDILNGLSHTRWDEYATTYRRAASARLQRLHHARKKAQVIKDEQQDRRLAQDLLTLAQQCPSEQTGSSASASKGTMTNPSQSSVHPSALRRSKRSTSGRHGKEEVDGP